MSLKGRTHFNFNTMHIFRSQTETFLSLHAKGLIPTKDPAKISPSILYISISFSIWFSIQIFYERILDMQLSDDTSLLTTILLSEIFIEAEKIEYSTK
jgi:hypothetical protein